MTSATTRKKTKQSAAPARNPRDTPAMRQYDHFRGQHPGCVLFFRMGDFYEMFDEDAVLVHRVLGLTLTERANGIPMAGVPYHALDGYVRRMVEQGYKIAICDQIQDPKDAKGVVDRAVTRVLTPGTLMDEALLDEGRPNLVAAVDLHGETSATIALAEVSTGAFDVAHVALPRLRDELARFGPSEVLHAETDDGNPPAALADACRAIGCPLTARAPWSFRPSDAHDLLLRQFGVRTLQGFGFDADDPSLGAAGALVRYLQETQAPDAAPGEATLHHLRPPRRRTADGAVVIDQTSLHSLEIERTMRSGQLDGSLLSVFQACRTPMGKRLLREWLCFPLCDRTAITARQDAVAALVDDRTLADALATPVGGVQDVARIVGRVALRRASPRDLVALGRSTSRIDAIADHLDGAPALTDLRARLQALTETLAPLAATILERCVDDPPAHLREGGLFRDGIDADLDDSRTLQRDANSWLAQYQAELVESTGIPSLKVGFNRVFGYYIEITHAHRDRIPDVFTRKQTLKNAERYITPELKTFEERVMTAESRAIERERVLFEALCHDAAAAGAALSDFASCIATLDALLCFATVAVRERYVRPEIVEENVLEIIEGRHPVLDRALGERFVPNDCRLGTSERGGDGPATLALITGPNMAGKSTAIRQAALITLLAHTGSFVPAASARIGIVDRIFTRVGASDELHTGQSTFMVEMTETANILHHATERSLVILDEIGRGTSTYDGLALAWAIAETIADIGARTLFATHYHELTALADQRSRVTNLHVAVREWGDEIVFLYRIEPGRTDRSYGIHVARIAGLPRATIDRANEVLGHLVADGASPNATVPHHDPPEPSPQLGLFDQPSVHPAVERLRSVQIEVLSPLDAFDLVRELARDARDS